MNAVAMINAKIGILLQDMYALGEEEGRKVQREEDEKMEAEAYDKGADEGYAEAKREFRPPDL